MLGQVGANIHTDDDYAREQGLTAVIADGMMMTNWCSTMMIEHFGMDYVARGELRTKFIKPVYLGETVFVKGKVRAKRTLDNGDVVYELDVWCDNDKGVKVTDGDGKVVVAAIEDRKCGRMILPAPPPVTMRRSPSRSAGAKEWWGVGRCYLPTSFFN